MNPNAPQTPSATVRCSAYPSEQPFPGAVPVTSPVSQPRRTVMEIPSPLPRPSFIFRGDGVYSNDASWVFSAWATRINQYISASSAATDINEIHQPRCFLLSAACKQHDIVYIVMHHRYCTWSRNREAVYQLMQPYAPAAIDKAFAVLSVLLKSNDVLPTTQIEWFSNFPASTFDSYIPGPILTSITKEIFEFLSTFAAQWQDFQARIIARGFPVLVWEVAQTLRCSSSCIQDLIFTLSRRLLGCPEGGISNAFSELFSSDRHFESSIRSNHFSADHIQQTRNTLVGRYLSLVALFRSQAPSPMAVASPTVQVIPARTPAAQVSTQGRSSTSQSPMLNKPPSRLPSTERPVQSQHSWTPSAINKNVPSTTPPTTRPVPSNCGSADTIPKIAQYNGTPRNHFPAACPTPVRPQNVLASMAQPTQPAVAQDAIPPIHNSAALLDPAPGKVFRPIPESEYPKSAYSLASLKVGLHLARQRSPCRIPNDLEATEYYQYVESFIVQPTKLNVSTHLTQIKFSLSEDQLQKLPVRQAIFDICTLPVVRFENNTLRFRVRVCRFASGDTEISESRWARASTFWPAQMQIMINSMPCFLSRKQHFHADLPAEMSADLKAGYNELHISLPSLSGNERGHDYFIAIEQITTQNHASVWACVNSSPHASAETTKDTIKQYYGLSGTNEIALLGSTSNVSVCDPISSRMCDTPVRGLNCKHLQCFDLENWLRSRTKKPSASPTEPCLVDCWACPICGGDARPNQLRICDYFSNITKQLRESGHSETRIIALSDNGEWESQVEASYHQKRECSSQPRGLPDQPQQASKEIEIIEILDD